MCSGQDRIRLGFQGIRDRSCEGRIAARISLRPARIAARIEAVSPRPMWITTQIEVVSLRPARMELTDQERGYA
ncbi:hypothetical protein L3X38_013420 [Prunus dulcis]|uniref:Uncharacterized protein n=1 Tax=Prunus dulcis TaxID=3755 RepID=A0AAD4WL65_PRUDU|nr:hypothetical protein L3X38_013420 [Prunus dulcis]